MSRLVKVYVFIHVAVSSGKNISFSIRLRIKRLRIKQNVLVVNPFTSLYGADSRQGTNLGDMQAYCISPLNIDEP
jgi:hypothetical protein